MVITLENILILVALGKESSLHPPSKLLLCYLISTDLFVGLLLEPLFLSHKISIVTNRRKLCRFLKPILNAFGLTVCGFALCIISTISVDRYLALVLKLNYRATVTTAKVRVTVVVLSMFNMSMGALSFWDQFAFSAAVSATILVCITVSTFCYLKIYHNLRHQGAKVRHQLHLPRGTDRMSTARYRKSVSTTLWVYCALVLCYCPHMCMTVVVMRTGMSDFLFYGQQLTVSLVYLNSFLNPFLYCWKIKEVRQAVKETVKNLYCQTS